MPDYLSHYRRYRRTPYLYAPLLVGLPIYTVCIVAGGATFGLRGLVPGALVGLAALASWSLATQHPLLRYAEPRGARGAESRFLRAAGRRPLGAMTLGVIAAALWVGFWMLVFREPWGEVERASFVLTVVTLGSMVGLIWWEIFLGGELRKRAARGHPRARPESPPA